MQPLLESFFWQRKSNHAEGCSGQYARSTDHRRDVGTGGLGATKALQHLGGAGRRAGMPRRPIPPPVSIGTTNVSNAVEKIAGTRSSSAAVWRTGLGVALEL